MTANRLHREAMPGQYGTVIASHRNSEGELATIERVDTEHPRFPGELLLCFYDEDSLIVAPMFLDTGTVAWLNSVLNVTRFVAAGGPVPGESE
jgi:hypothetical protein